MARLYVTLSLLLYLLALCLDAVHLSGGNTVTAQQALFQGPWGVVFGLFGWFANPLFGLALLLRRRLRWLALFLGAWALYLAVMSHAIERLPDNINYSFHDVIGFAPGYYLWALAIAAFCIGQAWWCSRGRDVEVPRWSLPEGALALLLLVVMVIGLRDENLRFDFDKLFDMPPSVWEMPPPARYESI
ncbi:hypothetical protein [Pseudomonas sp. NyZ201]|uniref:hypothetical protein n=1 Tax=Pseudomonas sp. NyZ201 TaxID=3409857 RepID=UPI003CEA94B7